MHSSFRKELCGTPKIYKTVRTRPGRRHFAQIRRFSNRTSLFGQSSPKDGSTNCAGGQPEKSNNSKDPLTNSSAPAHGIGADLERWIQHLSDRGQSLHVWDTISEKDETGKRRLLPHIKKELENLGQQTTQDGKTEQTIGLEIQDGHIRPLTSTELRQDKKSSAQNGDIGAIILRSDSSHEQGTARDAARTPSTTDAVNPRQNTPLQKQEQISQEQLANEGEEISHINGSNIISKFHGSSSARRQRERQSRLRDKSLTIVLPEWFHTRNVTLREELQLNAFHTDSSIEPGVPDYPNDNQPVLSEPQSNPAESEAPQVMKEPESQTVTDSPPIEKKQTHTSGAGNDEPAGDGSGSQGPNEVGGQSPTLVALPNANKRYYIQAAQRTELTMTARGRLRLPVTGPQSSKPGGIRSHILVHYTAHDGDLFLDRLIEDVAHQLHCNIINLDAQDIAALIAKADIDPMMADEAKTLSYEIYGDIYREESQEEDHSAMFPEEMEEGDEESGPNGPQGIPFMVGKPITIDLKALFGPRNSRRNNAPFMPKNMLPDLMGRASMTKPTPHIFQALVESILSSTSIRRKASNSEAADLIKDDSSDTPSSLSKDATIVHVKDLKAIQETNVGKHFLSQLYDQVERRRSNGEAMMLIGTSCERSGPSSYDIERIRNMQVSEPDEISSTIVITPAYPTIDSEMDSETSIRDEIQRNVVPKQDRAKRVQLINARHLYEMLQSKDIPLDSLQEGFWTKDLAEQLKEPDQECLSKSFWSFSYIQRLAAILASSSSSEVSNPIASAVNIIDESDKLKYSWAKQTQPEKSRHSKKDKDSDSPEHDRLAQIRSKATKHEKKLLSGVIEPRKIPTTFKDIHIPPETVEALQTLTTLSLVRPDAFKYGVLASDRIPGLLLYGPPGTGKTLAAKAVARESGATMLEVSAADINDMYVGEGEKNVKALFSLAKKLSPCVVFLDEADAMFSARSNAGRRVSHRELLNQFLKEWDGMSNDSGSAFIMVATNRPMDLDDAVLRRLPRRLLVDLPTEKDRLEILKIHLRHEHIADDVDLANIASRTQFYSGSDLKNVAVAAALSCVREENELAKAHTGAEAYMYPAKRTLTSAHFDRALEEISASISEDMASLRDIKKFDEQYGDRKGRKRKSPKWGFKSPAEADAILDTVKVRQ